MSRRSPRKGKGGGALRGLLFLGLGLALGAGLVWGLFLRDGAPRAPAERGPAPRPEAKAVPVTGPAPPATTQMRPSPAPPLPKDFEPSGETVLPRLTVVLDDLGFESASLERLESFEGPFTLAAIPSAPKARDVAALARRKGWELLVHFPMAPDSGRAEDGAVGPDDADTVISDRVAAALDRFPDAVGLNNHQGSRATRDPRVMRAVLSVLKARGLLFLDSRTTAATVGEVEAQRLSVLTLSRDVFLDDAETERAAEGGTEESLAKAWRRALGIARKRGHAVLIGHPRRETLEFLAREAPLAKGAGIRLARLTDLVDG